MQEEKKAIINTNTLLPISFVLTLMAGAWFISDLNSRVRSLEAYYNYIPVIKEDVSSIKTDMNWIKSTLGGAEITK